jgi:sorting nexin-29
MQLQGGKGIPPGIDQIMVELIQAGGETLLSELHKLINSIWNREQFPEQWKEYIIILVYKKGDRIDCSNYQGVSLLSASYNMLSNILLSRLSPYLDETFGNHHCGFRYIGSATSQSLCVRQILEKK